MTTRKKRTKNNFVGSAPIFAVLIPFLIALCYYVGFLSYKYYLSTFALDYSILPVEPQVLILNGFFSAITTGWKNLILNLDALIGISTFALLSSITTLILAYSIAGYELNKKGEIRIFGLLISRHLAKKLLFTTKYEIRIAISVSVFMLCLFVFTILGLNAGYNAGEDFVKNMQDEKVGKGYAYKLSVTQSNDDKCHAYIGYLIACSGLRCAFAIKSVGTVLVSENIVQTIEPITPYNKERKKSTMNSCALGSEEINGAPNKI
jgi:hypothetical protein